jgi:hypothetical protein
MMHFDVIHGEHRGTVEPLSERGCRKIREEFHSTLEINITTSIFALVIGILMSDNTTVRVEHIGARG